MKLKILLFTLKLIKILFTIITLSVIAKYFGNGISRDNWLLAYSLFVVIDLALWGPVNETFRAKFVELLSKNNEKSVINGAKSLFSFINYCTLLVALILYLLAPLIGEFLLPNGSESDKLELINMIQLISPSLILNQATLFLTSVLNAYNIFYVPEISGIISVVFNVLFILIFINTLGIYSLFVGHYFSLILLLLLLIYQIHKKKIPILLGDYKFDFKNVKPYLLFALPFFIPYFFGQIGTIVEKYLAGLISVGTISNIDYSRKFLDIPINVITSVITTVYVPVATRLFFSKEIKKLREEFYKFLKFGFLVLLLIVCFIIFFSNELVEFLYNKGTISDYNLSVINNTIQLYALGAIAIFLYTLIGLSLIATGSSKKYAFYGVLTQISVIGGNIFLYKYLAIYVFPLSLLIFHLIASLLMLSILYKNKIIINYSLIIRIMITFLIVTVFIYLIKSNFFTEDKFNLLNILKKIATLMVVFIPIFLFELKDNLKLYIKK